MLRFTITAAGEIAVEQRIRSPAVYLDHWALRHLSENQNAVDRFVSAMRRLDGDFLFSWLNLAEYTKLTDGRHGQAAEQLLEQLLPNVFLIESDPFTVIDEEQAILASGKVTAPHADSGLARALATRKPDSVRPFTARGLVTAVHGTKLDSYFDQLVDTVVARVEALRCAMESDSDFSRTVRQPPRGTHQTKLIVQELIRGFLIDRSIPVTRNHAIDFMHAAVPISYADYVLLDKHWKVQVERVRARLEQAQIDAPFAEVYSKAQDGVERFLCQLESRVSEENAAEV